MKNSNMFKKLLLPTAMAATFSLQATEVKVKIDLVTPEGGVFVTPVWVGFHDGSFNSYDNGTPASVGIERIAEDGNTADLSALFAQATQSGQDATIANPDGPAPVFEPGSSSTMVFDLDETTQRYFSYATMIIPSNDAFVANGNPVAHPIFDENGEFVGPFSFTVYGTQVRDAGTEENTETEAAFLNQTGPDMGVATSDVITNHPGFNGSMGNPEGTPVNILGGTVATGDMIDAVNGDFTRGPYPIMRVTISKNTTPVRVTIKNSAAENGTFLTPFWTAFHDGQFDVYDLGAAASPGLEALAEDGNNAVISEEFAAAGGAGFDTVITNPEGFGGAPLFDPGLSTQSVFELDPSANQYFSYATMILPSNDAFVANADPKAHKLFYDNGNFAGPVSFTIYGSQVRDAGTEENTESDAPFFNQSEPNTGVTTDDVVSVHPGFNGSEGNPDGTPQVFLGGTNPPGFSFDENADFTRSGFKVAEVEISRLVDGSFSGTWFSEERNGEGFLLEVTGDGNGGARGVVTWYTYDATGSGTQRWLVGNGPVVGDTLLADMSITDGASFGSAFDPDDVIVTPWGQVSVKFTSCTTATVSFNSVDADYGSGSYDVRRLTTGPVDFKGACQL